MINDGDECMRTIERREKSYYDLIAYVASNAVAGELMAIDNYSEMVPLLEGTEAKIETVKQASDEAKHVRLLSSLSKRLTIPIVDRIVEPQWKAIRKHCSEAARRGDLASCLIAQDVMVETLAVVLYRTLGRNTDIDTKRIAGTILDDELHHLQIGLNRIRTMLDADPEAVLAAFSTTQDAVMPQLLSMISYSCESLCDDLGVECSSLRLDSIQTDLDTVRVEALDTYIEMLDRLGLDSKANTPLLARLSEYGERPWAPAELSSCCGASAAGAIESASCCAPPGDSARFEIILTPGARRELENFLSQRRD
jgi:fatty aldehyde decarbonylase